MDHSRSHKPYSIVYYTRYLTTLDEGHLEHTHTERYSLLQKAITVTNSSKLHELEELPNTIFEPEEKFIQKLQSTHLYDDYLTVRCFLIDVRTFFEQNPQ